MLSVAVGTTERVTLLLHLYAGRFEVLLQRNEKEDVESLKKYPSLMVHSVLPRFLSSDL